VRSLLLLGGLCLYASALCASSDSDALSRPAARRPAALVASPDGRWLYVANRQAGTVSVLDANAGRPVAEMRVARRLADLSAAGPDRLVGVDEEAGELLVLRTAGSKVECTARCRVSPAPVSVRATDDGARCYVASLWSRRLTAIELGDTPRVLWTIDLPFAPRLLLPVKGATRLVIADAFGGRLAVADARDGKLLSVRTLQAHNIRGLALDHTGSRLLLAHQMLKPTIPAARDEIHWGNLLTNNVRSLALERVLDPSADVQADEVLYHLGDVGQGAGDPAGLAALPDGRLMIALAGVREVAIGPEKGGKWDRVAVGTRPTAITMAGTQTAYVVNTLSDSVAKLDWHDGKTLAEIALGTSAAETPEERGERLFFDARLSHDGWLSCQSCHTDGHTSGLLNDNLSDGSYGTPKRILSLLGARDTAPYAWNGTMPTLDAQVRTSIEKTMSGATPTAEQVRDLAAYLRTLEPAPSLDRLRGLADDAVVRRGHDVFKRQGCTTCHAPPAYTSPRSYDVGLRDEAGLKRFNPPSLRGLSQGGPYLHDGRAVTLDDVFTRHRHELKSDLSHADLRDLTAFLRSL
jgi:YVTN family beta-propeller protein